MKEGAFETKGEFEAYIQSLKDSKKSIVEHFDNEIDRYEWSLKFTNFDDKGNKI